MKYAVGQCVQNDKIKSSETVIVQKVPPVTIACYSFPRNEEQFCDSLVLVKGNTKIFFYFISSL